MVKKIYTKKHKILIILCFLLFIFVAYFSVINLKYEDNSELKANTYVALGVYDSNGILDDGEIINIPNDNIAHHIIELDQEIEENREYLLIAMIDFKQSPFTINNKVHETYTFDTKKNDSVKFELDIQIPEGSKELSYIIIKKPNFMPDSFNLEKILPLQMIMSKRFNLNNSNTVLKYETNLKYSSEGPFDNIWISDNESKLNAIYKAKGEDTCYITLGNDSNESIDYALVMYNNWKQSKFTDGSIVKYLKVNPNQKQTLKVKLPNTNEKSMFQVIAFPMPYNITKVDSYTGSLAYGSLKFILEPK